MLQLAMNYKDGPLFLKDIARKEDISEKYLSQIVIVLKARNLISSFRGAKGGYTLAKRPSEITLKEIVRELEGGFTLVPCLSDSAVCARESKCAARDLWDSLRKVVTEKLEAVTLEDLVRISKEKNDINIMYNI
jgi:Rrf2 family protein